MNIAEFFPTSIIDLENEDLILPVSLLEIQNVLAISKNNKIPGPDGIPVEFYRVLFDVLGLDLLRVVDDSQKFGKVPATFNSTFIALIPKIDLPKSFEDFKPISLCNFCYKIIGNIILIRIQKVLGRYISCEQFGFLPGRQIHDTVGLIQEGLHTIHVKNLMSVVLKIDLSKAYDRVSWTYLRIILSKMGFSVPFISWIMSSLSSVSFDVLINGVAPSFCKSGKGLRQGCPLALLLFSYSR